MRAAAVLFTLLCAYGSAAGGRATVALFDSPADALRDLVRGEPRPPRVLAFGEVHELEGGPKATPAIRRFIDEMLAAVPAKADLVVETWVPKGTCGKVEREVIGKVEEMTKRPESTETDVVRLLRLGKAAGMRPHILEIACATYETLKREDGSLDAVRLLGVVTRELERVIVKQLGAAADATVVVYGGAIHNDRAPRQELAEFSFGKTVERAAGGRYVEIDLYVPEYVETDAAITGAPWWPRYLAAIRGHATQTARVRLGPGSYVLLFPRSGVARR